MTTATDSAVRIVKGGTISSTSLSASAEWSATEELAEFGGATELWGETWTAEDINASNFGVVISAFGNEGWNAKVDFVEITVYYTEGGGGSGVAVVLIGPGGLVY